MTHALGLSTALLALLAAREQGREWPTFRGDPALRGVAGTSVPEAPALLWTWQGEKAITSSPVVCGGRVFFGGDDQHVRALALATGEELWAFPTEDVIEAPPLCFEGRVFVGSSDGFVYALAADTGELAWKHATNDKILGGANALPAREGRPARVVVGSYDGSLYCLDAATGDLAWSYETANYVNGTPAVDGERIVFGGCDAVLHVVGAADGKALAQIDLGPESHVAGSVAVADGRVYLGHYGNAFVCVDLASGETAWRYEDPRHAFFSSPAIAPDRVVFGGRDKSLHCARRSDGERLWTFPTRKRLDSSPILVGERVLVATGEGRLHLLALADGKELWSYDLGTEIYSSPAVAEERIVVTAGDGRVCAFGAAPAREAERGGGER